MVARVNRSCRLQKFRHGAPVWWRNVFVPKFRKLREFVSYLIVISLSGPVFLAIAILIGFLATPLASCPHGVSGWWFASSPISGGLAFGLGVALWAAMSGIILIARTLFGTCKTICAVGAGGAL